jgi:glycosyltransferase involved in cell wall biosynthesis
VKSFSDPHQERVSVIIPCFNSGTTLRRSVDSVIDQDWVNLEVIIIDDGSNDQYTLKELLELRKYPQVKLITQNNKGLACARNTGIQKATGQFILPLDADDWLNSDAILKMVKVYKLSKENVVVYSNIKLHGKQVKIKNTFSNEFEQLFSNQLPYCMLFPKLIFHQHGGYDENLRQGFEDWEFNIRLITGKQKFSKLDEPVFNYTISNSGMLKSKTMSLYVTLWRYIRNKNRLSYKIGSLCRLYIANKHEPANRKLPVYSIYWVIFSFLHPLLGNRLARYISKVRSSF